MIYAAEMVFSTRNNARIANVELESRNKQLYVQEHAPAVCSLMTK